jgi:peroxiredoxin
MRQLVQLKQKEAEFKKLKTELVFVFREERGEVAGLKAIQAKRKTKFTLVTDLGAKKTKAYSGKRGQFATYVLDKKGIIRAVIDGTKPKRPPAEPILKIIKSFDDKKDQPKK